MLISATTKIGAGVQYMLAGSNDFEVGAGITVHSTGDSAVETSTGKHEVSVAGVVISNLGLALDLGTAGNGSRITVVKGGLVFSDTDIGVKIGGQNATVVNNGTIGGQIGINISSAGGGTSRVVNSGTILAQDDAVAGGDQRVIVTNTGVLSSDDGFAIRLGVKNDVVMNKGAIFDSVYLGMGNDLYDGRLGKLTGYVDGAEGNDVFRPGITKETFFGGDGLDTVDFRAGGAVQVSLDGVFANTGAAKGDSYADIEWLFGSLKGADRLGGTGQDNDIRGFGGNDRLQGEAGHDVLRGGLGKDTLSGGANDDNFVFDALNEAGDVISDFGMGLGNDDAIYVNDTGFGGLGTGAVMATLSSGKFKSGANNLAGDANDRFIFRTGDNTLWFDRDGTGSAFHSVLVADLQAGAVLTAADIIII